MLHTFSLHIQPPIISIVQEAADYRLWKLLSSHFQEISAHSQNCIIKDRKPFESYSALNKQKLLHLEILSSNTGDEGQQLLVGGSTLTERISVVYCLRNISNSADDQGRGLRL